MTDRFDIMSPRRKGEKTFWTRVGSMFPAKSGDGWAIKLDALPLPDEKGEVWIRAFPPKDDDADRRPRPAGDSARTIGRHAAPAPAGRPDWDDSIPFAPEWR